MTVVNRRVFIASRGAIDNVVNMLKEGTKTVPYRIYRSSYGQFDQVALEMEFENIADMEIQWNKWSASDEAQEFLSRWHEVTETGGTNEIWILEDEGGD